MQTVQATPAPSFMNLLYRYWFYGWLFRDVNAGNAFERRVAWKHNRSCARWLPLYLKRWTVLGLVCWAAGWLIESVAPPLVQIIVYLPTAVSVSVDIVTLAAWLGLMLMPDP